MLKVKILLKGERIMKKIKAFKINRILMEMKKAKEMLGISCGFLCYFVDKKKNYILFLRLRN